MKSVVVGTAGHIDHGKTALVRALTGIETDRLEEEKRRGISIDLGFAHLTLGELRIAFIDVPGHERFVKNMLAGVGGIDAVLFVIAADESIKPQTREHFEICKLLRIPRGVVALTKADLVDPEILELVRLEVDEFVAGSFLEAAPVVAVSAVTRAGLDELRASLSAVLRDIVARDAARNFRLPVDRAFVIQGFGTVVTGTLMAGSVALEDEVESYPGGLGLRVRSIQVHGSDARRASAGQRTALNVAGAEPQQLPRGTSLAAPGCFRTTTRCDCMFELLPTARPLKNRAPVHLHAGTAEVLAEVRTLDRKAAIEPGTVTPVRLILREPLLLMSGDRFVVRMFSPVVTIGGGEVIDAFPPAGLRTAGAGARTLKLATAGTAERIGGLVGETPGGLPLSELIIRTGLTAAAIEAAMPATVLKIPAQSWYVDRGWVKETTGRWLLQLAEFHRSNPLLAGVRREEFRSREMPDVPAGVFDAILAEERTIAATGEVLHLATHKLALKQDEELAVSKIAGAFERSGLSVPSVREVLESSGVDASRSRSLLQILLRNKTLVRVNDDLVFHRTAVEALRATLSDRRGTRFSIADFKDWTGISRKYAIPLLEYLDRERITRRDCDQRVIL